MDKSQIIDQIMALNQYEAIMQYLNQNGLYNYLKAELSDHQIDLNQYVAPDQIHLLKRDLVEIIINSEL